MRTIAAVAVMVAAVVAAPASARDTAGYRAIATGDLAVAESKLTAERRIFPARPELMLNLASVYARTGRIAEAHALYADVLARENVSLDLSNGRSVMSHDLANMALTPVQVATR